MSDKENNYPLPTYRSDISDVTACNKIAQAPTVGGGKPTVYAPAPPTVPPSGGAVADYYNRRPLAPAYPLHPANRANIAPIRGDPSADCGAPSKAPGIGYGRPHKPTFAPPVARDSENMAPAPPPPPVVPTVQYERHQPRAPQRLQYQHNRVW